MSSPETLRPIRSFDAEFDPLALPEASAVAHLVVRVEAEVSEAQRPRPPLRLAVVVDRSGSMSGRPLRLASEAAQGALSLLRPGDEFCLVFFSHHPELAVDFGPASAERLAAAVQRCAEVEAGGNTHLSAGWQLGCEALRRTPLPQGTTALCLLLSDGYANAGETRAEALGEMARAMRIAGVATTCVGLGREVDEALLDGMARSGEGRFYFAELPEELRGIFTSEVGDALQVVSPATSLVLEARNPAAEAVAWQAVSSFRVEGPRQPFAVALGDLTSGQTLTAVVEVQLPRGAAGERLEFSAHLRDAAGQELAAAVALELRRTTAAEAAAQPRDLALWRTVAEQRVHRARRRALELNGRGEWDAAASALTDEARVLQWLAGPHDAAVADLVAALLQEAERVRQSMDELERKLAYKEATYASRSRTVDGRSLKAALDLFGERPGQR